MAYSTHIVCFGNELHGDDGFGAAMHAALADRVLPPGIRLMRADAGSPGAIDCFDGCESVVVVDILSGFGEPGTVHCLPGEALQPEETAAHGAGIGRLLETVRSVLDQPPRVQVVGVEAARIDAFCPGLSGPVAAALPAATRRVMACLP
ncbi:MAG: hydrogenase maturation protease [Rhodocyclaceae bacterium]|nr:hydrogenase maturation protease [Rhodocyclaceae bacterium]